MTKKPNFGPDPHFFVGFTCTSNETLFQAIILCNLKAETNAPNLKKWQKT